VTAVSLQPAIAKRIRPSIGCGAQVQRSVKLHSAVSMECRSWKLVLPLRRRECIVEAAGGGRKLTRQAEKEQRSIKAIVFEHLRTYHQKQHMWP